jgi:hypothetical protein
VKLSSQIACLQRNYYGASKNREVIAQMSEHGVFDEVRKDGMLIGADPSKEALALANSQLRMSHPFEKLFVVFALQLAIHKQKNRSLQPILCHLARTTVGLGVHLCAVRHSLVWRDLSGTPVTAGTRSSELTTKSIIQTK